jgi:hypothetical protein
MQMAESCAEVKPAYWFFGENQLECGCDPTLGKPFRSLLFHGLVYEPSLVVSDSYAVNNLNLRRGIRQDHQVQEAIFRGLFRIACREEGDPPARQSLIALRDAALRKYPAERWGESDLRYFPREEYAQSEELEFLERHAAFIPFSLAQVGECYTSGVQEFLRTEARATDLLGNDAAVVLEELVAEEVRRNNGRLLRAFFYGQPMRAEFEQRLRTLGGWGQFGQQVEQIADAFYVTALPDLIGASPLYPEKHARAIELQRRRRRNRVVQQARESHQIESRLNPADFVEALALLRAEDISALHQSDEWRRYRQSLEAMANRREIHAAYQDYRRQIDDTVMSRLGDPMTQPAYLQFESAELLIDSEDGNIGEEFIQHLIDEGLSHALEGARVAATMGVGGLVRNLYQRTGRKESGRQFRQAQAAVRGYIHDEAVAFFQQRGGGRIQATTHVEVDFHATQSSIKVN